MVAVAGGNRERQLGHALIADPGPPLAPRSLPVAAEASVSELALDLRRRLRRQNDAGAVADALRMLGLRAGQP